MVSIIIPVYNGEKYLPRCLDSILAQSDPDFELILIDDGSADGSLALCREYAKKDPRVQVIHQENQGVSSARNAGLRAATGEYIAFIDADDYIMPDYLEQLIRLLEQTHADIACCDFIEIITDGLTEPNPPRVKQDRVVQDRAVLFSDMLHAEEGYFACVWGKLIRAELAKVVSFHSFRFGEDHLYIFDLFTHSPKVALSTYKGYYYVPNEGSVTVKNPIISVSRSMEEMRMHKYKAEHLPEGLDALYDQFYHNYAQSVVCLIGAVCRDRRHRDGRQTARQEARQILRDRKRISPTLRLRLQLFCLSPQLYGTLLRLTGKC